MLGFCCESFDWLLDSFADLLGFSFDEENVSCSGCRIAAAEGALGALISYVFWMSEVHYAPQHGVCVFASVKLFCFVLFF